MLVVKRLPIIFASVFFLQTGEAQHNNSWFRGTVSLAATTKWKVDAELQHRRQSGIDNRNIIDENLMYSFRSWIHYQHSKYLKFSISPFAYYSNYRIIRNRYDENAKPIEEIRFSASAEFQHKLIRQLHFIDRLAVENRMFTGAQPDALRFRNRIGLRYDFNTKFKTGIYQEIFLNMTGVQGKHYFDHNRLAVQTEFQLSPRLKTEFAFIYITRLPLNSDQKLYENNLYLGFVWNLYTIKR
ncbi:DUF2490 domain-containing protein [Pollutibacter soli]|uniref:DUF2490 domain-containing protein n=1 Tax=Pollutibacter soli TaxID=3034157 RepID=UPI003013E8C5